MHITSGSFRARISRIGVALAVAVVAALSSVQAAATRTSKVPSTALGIDVNFYTGPITQDVWQQVQRAGEEFAIAQAWGGRSRNEYAASQLAGARSVGIRTAAYVLLNYDNQVCPTFDRPVRSAGGRCAGDPIPQPQQGDRWRVNLFRCVGKDPDRGYLAWQPTKMPKPGFHLPEVFGWLIFA